MSSQLALLIGPSPPPYNGMSVANELVTKALDGVVPYIRLDTADRRDLSNVGKFELLNILLAAKHGIKSTWLLFSRRPGIVYVPISQAWLPFLRDCLFLIPARVARRKLVIHLHGAYFGSFYKQSSLLMQALIRYSLSKASLAIVLGESVRDVFDGILSSERIRVVSNGIQDNFASRAKERNGTVQLLYLGSLDAQKGILDILRALSRMRNKQGSFRLIFAGSWYSQRDRRRARQIINESGMERYIEFVGTVESSKKDRLLSSVDVLVLPSKNEGQPYVVLEGMAASLPVVATKVGCIPETIRDGIEGFLVEPGDVSGLAERLDLLIQNETLRKRMGEAARQRFLEKYTYERFSSRIRGVFREVLAEV